MTLTTLNSLNLNPDTHRTLHAVITGVDLNDTSYGAGSSLKAEARNVLQSDVPSEHWASILSLLS